MPALLSEFASPTEVEIQNAWKDAVFVLDTNVLLHIYRYPEQLRESLFKAIDSVKGSLWIPHHVALEFERRRTDIIFSEKDNTEQAGKNLTKLKNDIQKIIDQADFDKWTITFDYAGSLKKITTELDELSTAVSKISERRLQLSSGDEHRDRLASIVSGGIGAAYESQAFLEAIYREGEERYARKVPPGYGDEKTKDKTPDYQHGGLVYKPKFGDLII